jgi:hypothetical protein
MIQKVVHKCSLDDSNQIQSDLEYWLSKTPEERIEAVEILRRQYHGNSERLQRVARVIRKKQKGSREKKRPG